MKKKRRRKKNQERPKARFEMMILFEDSHHFISRKEKRKV